MIAVEEHTASPASMAATLPEQAGLRTSRNQLIDGIISLNHTATVAFLSTFPDAALRRYLNHLLAAREPRGRAAAWVRPGDSPAIVVREPFD